MSVNEHDWIDAAYLVAAIFFIIGLKRLSSPATRPLRQPDRRGGHGHRDRRHAAATREIKTTPGSSSASLIGRSSAGAIGARRVQMTAMPQMVALFNGLGGGAAALVSLAELPACRRRPSDVGHGAASRAVSA